jgi:hypothetical protein
MGPWFENGSIIDLVLALVALEALLLLAHRYRTGRGIPALPLLANLAAGGCLMLAIRSALLDHGWGWIGVFMALALLAHLLDFGSRLLDADKRAS